MHNYCMTKNIVVGRVNGVTEGLIKQTRTQLKWLVFCEVVEIVVLSKRCRRNYNGPSAPRSRVVQHLISLLRPVLVRMVKMLVWYLKI